MADHNIFDKQSTDFLYTYLNNTAPTGFEAPGQQIWSDYIRPYVDAIESDAYGTVYGVINPDAPYKVVIEAHADEISWFVNYIDKDGMIHVIRNGGSDHAIAASMHVDIHTDDGIVPGVFGWPAIHVRRGKQADLAPKLENIFIDVGASSKDEVEKLGVKVGHVITFRDGLSEINDFYVGRALDNRMGGFCIAQVARRLKEEGVELPFGLYVVNAVQEEVGLRGAQMIAARLEADAAIVTDVTHDTSTPHISPKKYGDVKAGKGPTVTFAPSVHNALLRHILDTADKHDIALQREVASRSTGTDTDAFAYTGKGTPSALISLPLRYMHTTVEMAHKDDIQGVVDLIYQTLLGIDPKSPFTSL